DFIWVDASAPSVSSSPSISPSTSIRSANPPSKVPRLPIGARVIDSDRGRLKVVDDQGNEEWLEVGQKVKLMHPSSVQGTEDMIQLGELHESAILRNICIRYRDKLIYTFTGSILISVNPYAEIPIYGADEMRMYRRRRIGELPPHIFSIADNAYTSMRTHGRDQSIIISGESGSGKTESTKLVLQFLAAVSSQHSWIEQQILEANPILEAFGNAKTLRNDNSSRFGKYIDIHFSTTGAIDGARIEHYLLEKSRIVFHSPGERNYHIFYCLLAGLSEVEKSSMGLTKPEDFYYLNQGKSSRASRDDAADLEEIRAAMKVLLFKDEEMASIFRLLAAVLHIGNIRFAKSGDEGQDEVFVHNKEELKKVAKLLEVSESVISSSLTTKTLSTQGEIVVSSLSPQAALDTRDALAKGIYGRIFEHVNTRINDAIYKPKSSTKKLSIGVLDIFGFEAFTTNSFEQLCINYANEALQQFFVRHVFKLEQNEYDQEKINWSRINFEDNQATLDLIAAKPMNILSLIDEESIFPKGTDSTLLSKLHSTHGGISSSSSNPCYLRPKSDLQKAFGVRHYAGAVVYSVRGFLDKNRDTFSTDLHSLIAASKSRFLVHIFDGSFNPIGAANRRKGGSTVGGQFRRSLDSLMAALSSTEPFFVRCIKPNDDKKALVMDRDLVVRQLRNSGMFDAIRIRRAGYPIRHEYQSFIARYRVLLKGKRRFSSSDLRSIASAICEGVLGAKADFALGETKVFLKDAHDLLLEQAYFRRLNDSATTVQAAIRGFLHRSKFTRERNAAIVIQKTWRGYSQRQKYKKIVSGFTRLQAILRARQMVAHYHSLRQMITALQAHSRGALLRTTVRHRMDGGQRHSGMMAGRVIELVVDRPSSSEEYVRYEESNNNQTKSEEVIEKAEDGEIVKELFDFLPPNAESRLSRESNDENSSPRLTDDELVSYEFGKYAATHFTGSSGASHLKKPLSSPLLHHERQSSQQAALALWLTILRFMGDLAEPTPTAHNDEELTPVMSRLYQTLGRRGTTKSDPPVGSLTPSSRMHRAKKLISMTLKKSSKLKAFETSSASSESGEGFVSAAVLADTQPMSSLDKLHFIIGVGILRPELRDEVYCQLCKQLSGNPSKLSTARGWILLSLCVGCFAPSQKLLRYLLHFIRSRGPPGYSEYVEERLMRTIKNGTRKQPPSYVELQANKAKKPIVLAVTLMDGSVRTIHADSASTADEICAAIADKVALQDRFGFSLYIALFDKVSSLGSGTDHVLDAVSQCEQYAKEQGKSERSAPWRLFFRKEIFSPWHDPKEDPVSTNLIFEQVVRGIRYGEYRCDKDDDLALLCAQQYRIHEESMDVKKLEAMLSKLLPDFEINNNSHSMERWMQLVMNAYRKRFSSPSDSVGSTQSIKEEVVSFAKYKWPLLFSRFYEALKVGGPSLPRNEVIIAVNWTGVYVVDDSEEILVEFSFPEIAEVLTSSHGISPTGLSDTFRLSTIGGEEYSFQSMNADDVRELIADFLQGLKRRGRYLVGVKAQKDEDGLLEIERGDLLVLAKGFNGEMLLTQPEVRGENTRTGLQGVIKSESVYVLPTVTRPNAAAMDMFPRDWLEIPRVTQSNGTMRESRNALAPLNHFQAPYTLERFAAEHFTPSVSSVGSSPSGWTKTLTLRRRNDEVVERWRYSREPIRTPLLRRLAERQEPSSEAILAYSNIMKYMGDLPSRRSRIGTELTDGVFLPPLKYEVLRDEVYCQLMKQLTANPSIISEERGWELLWLATGIFAPSQAIYKELTHFLRSRPHPISIDCLHRCAKLIKIGSRKYPPHHVEVDAIQRKATQIYHKVFFPDQSEDAIEVSSCTRSSDLIHKIATRLGLKSEEGFSLFIKFADKVLSMPESEFFFDFIRQLSNWAASVPKDKDTSPPSPISYQVFFMRKLWLNAQPGEDKVADIVFHFHQELPKYLHGYHSCSKEDAVKLAALLLRARTREDMAAPLAQLSQLQSELVPKDHTKSYSSSEWKKQITKAYEKVSSMSTEEAKIAFLQKVSRWQTYGSAFFMVKQSSDPGLPEKLQIAINRNGLFLYNAETKNLVIQYPLTAISNWASGNTYFHVSVGSTNGKQARLLLETSMSYKMDDLLTSYLSLLIGAQTRNPRLALENQEI
ncbi:hypothetical protein PFISCL1PPCAC_24088, partial [Pristionchus fissidentatus]